MEQLNCVEETTESENPLWGGNNLSRSEDLREELQGNSERSEPTETKDDAEAKKDFWSIGGDFIYLPEIEPRVQLYVPKEETFPIPLKHIDVTRATYTNLDVLQESRIDDDWNVDVDRSFSDSWTGLTKFIFLQKKSKPPSGYLWSRERRTKIQATARPDYLWPEMWSGMSKAAQKKEKEEWALEKPKLEVWEAFISSIRKMERQRSHQKREEKVGDSFGGVYALQNGNKEMLKEAAGNRKREWWIQ